MILEGAIWAGQLDERTTGQVAERFVRQGLLGADHDQHDLRQAINDMNQRIRYAAGEYDTPPPPVTAATVTDQVPARNWEDLPRAIKPAQPAQPCSRMYKFSSRL